MITYNWIISSMETKPKDGSLTDVVIIVNWRRSATTIVDNKEYYTDVYGGYACSQPSTQDFTPYDQLTYDQVCGWLDQGLDVPALNATLDIQLENQINPPVVVLPNPWDVPVN